MSISYYICLEGGASLSENALKLIKKEINKEDSLEDKEINIMTCETICDPVPKMTKLITSPRALEIYAENKKRFVVTPKDRMGFIEAIVAANKRIHVQCTEYAATHRSYEKKRKRALKEEAKKANMDAE